MGSAGAIGGIRIAKAASISDFESAHALIGEMAAWDVAETGALEYPCEGLIADVRQE